MKKIIILLALYLGLVSLNIGIFSLTYAAEPSFIFADVKSGQAILTANDNYFNRMSQAEIAIRSQSTTADKTPHDLMNQYQENVLEWTEAEKKHITALVANNHEKLNTINHLLPEQVIFIKVTNLVEGGLPHTRANAIILPQTDKPLSEKLFFHELFHVLSRTQKQRHASLYGLIGFKACAFTANDHIRTISLTNPDVPAEAYYLAVDIDGKPSAILPFAHITRPAYDPKVKGGFAGHFGFGLLKIHLDKGKCRPATTPHDQKIILSPAKVPDFFAAIGRNTGYIIHPEEVLAENFVFALSGKKDLPNPEIPARLKLWLEKK